MNGNGNVRKCVAHGVEVFEAFMVNEFRESQISHGKTTRTAKVINSYDFSFLPTASNSSNSICDSLKIFGMDIQKLGASAQLQKLTYKPD